MMNTRAYKLRNCNSLNRLVLKDKDMNKEKFEEKLYSKYNFSNLLYTKILNCLYIHICIRIHIKDQLQLQPVRITSSFLTLHT